jgi:hypothetical protein
MFAALLRGVAAELSHDPRWLARAPAPRCDRDVLYRGAVGVALVRDQYDALVRIASSLRNRPLRALQTTSGAPTEATDIARSRRSRMRT